MAGLGAEDRAAHRFSCRIRKQGDRLVVSNEGTDPQYKAASSAYGSWRSGVLVAVGSFLGWDQLLCNAGALDHVSFEPTPGTLSVATYPAATTGVGGNTAAVYLSAFTVSKMLMSGPEDLARRANGAGGQSIPSFWFGAGNDRKGRFVVQPPGDVVAGALGAFPAPRRRRRRRSLVVAEQPVGQHRGMGGRTADPLSVSARAPGKRGARPVAGRQRARDGDRSAQDRRADGPAGQPGQRDQLRARPRRRPAGSPGRLSLSRGRPAARTPRRRRTSRNARCARTRHRRAHPPVCQGDHDHAPGRRVRRAVLRRRWVRRPVDTAPRAGRRRCEQRGHHVGGCACAVRRRPRRQWFGGSKSDRRAPTANARRSPRRRPASGESGRREPRSRGLQGSAAAPSASDPPPTARSTGGASSAATPWHRSRRTTRTGLRGSSESRRRSAHGSTSTPASSATTRSSSVSFSAQGVV